MFIKKLRGSIRLCIDYRKLNVITKKDKYLILLIKETIARIIGYKIITKLNIITKKDRYLILLIKETITRIISCKIIIKLNIYKAFN